MPGYTARQEVALPVRSARLLAVPLLAFGAWVLLTW